MHLYLLILLSLSITAASKLLVSEDNGLNWDSHTAPKPDTTSDAHIRLPDSTSPLIRIPVCALRGSLHVNVWKHKKGQKPVGLQWHSDECHANVKIAAGVTVRDKIIPRVKPDWLPYVRAKKASPEEPKVPKTKAKGIWNKYGLYIMIFVAIALAQGIRQGVAELRTEVAREDREEEEKKKRKVRVVVPKRKESKGRRKGAVGSSTKR